VCQKLSISEPTFHRWRNQYGGRKTSDAKRLKELEQENAGRRRAVAQLTLDKQMLQDVVKKRGDAGGSTGPGAVPPRHLRGVPAATASRGR
jgi:putative transposase